MSKKIIIKKILFVIALCASVLFVKAQIANAADFNITAPTNKGLVGAGYIDIKWDSVSGAKNYDVYIGGSKKTTTTNTVYTFYSTTVEALEVCVVANLNDGGQKGSNKVQFGVTKKGLGLNSTMGSCVDVKSWGLGWYYNWGETPYTAANYKGAEYVPMIWKSTTSSDTLRRGLNAQNAGYKYLLTFNEPDLKGQCDLPVDTVYAAWKGLKSVTNIKVSSPVTASWPKNSSGWFQPFMNKLTSSDRKPDFISIHCYPENYGGAGMANWFVEEVVDWTWNKYHIPIWITEFSTFGEYITATGNNGTKEFWETVMPLLDARPYVERYAAFGFDARSKKNVGLWYYSTGAWTEGGRVYRELGNPDFNNVKLSGVDYSKLKKSPAGSGDIAKPAKVKLSSVKYKKKRKILVKFKKALRAEGYQIRWCDSRSFSGYEQKNTKKLKYTIKGLDKNTKYFVKVRAYNMKDGAKQFGSWSSVKKVKVKK